MQGGEEGTIIRKGRKRRKTKTGKRIEVRRRKEHKKENKIRRKRR